MREIEFEERAVAFLDIQGFTNFIKKAEQPKSEEYKKLCQLHEVINNELDVSGFHIRLKPTCTYISDSIILSAFVGQNKYDGLVGVSIKTIQIAHQLLSMGFLLRGGIAVGRVSHSSSNVYGTGYLDAYETENKLAETPRVLLHKSAAEILDGNGKDSSGMQVKVLSTFLKEGEQWIVDTLFPHENYVPLETQDFSMLFEGYRKTITENLLRHRLGSRERSKWEWMAEFFNWKLNDMPSSFTGLKPIVIPSIKPFNREEVPSTKSLVDEFGMAPM